MIVHEYRKGKRKGCTHPFIQQLVVRLDQTSHSEFAPYNTTTSTPNRPLTNAVPTKPRPLIPGVARPTNGRIDAFPIAVAEGITAPVPLAPLRNPPTATQISRAYVFTTANCQPRFSDNLPPQTAPKKTLKITYQLAQQHCKCSSRRHRRSVRKYCLGRCR